MSDRSELTAESSDADQEAEVARQDTPSQQVQPAPDPDSNPSKEELSQLPRRAIVAFAVRCAWRVLPALGSRGHLNFWDESHRVRHLRSIDAALTLTAGNLVDTGRFKDYDGRTDNAYSAAATRAAANYAASHSVAFGAADAAADAAAYAASAAYWVSAAAADAAYAAANAAATDKAANAAATRRQNRIDFEWLRGEFETVGPESEITAKSLEPFLFRPLWESDEPGEAWEEIEGKFRQAVIDLDCHSIWDRYAQLRSGKGIDWEQAEQDLQIWKELIDQEKQEDSETESKEQDKKEESETLPEVIGIAAGMADEIPTEDLLGRTPLVNALADMFAAPEQGTPFTVGLLGDWGAGKSTVLKFIRDRLEKIEESTGREFDFAVFNAWQYEKTKTLAAGLAHEVVETLYKNLGVRRLSPDATTWSFLRNTYWRLEGWIERTWTRIRIAWRGSSWAMRLSVIVALGGAIVAVMTRSQWWPSTFIGSGVVLTLTSVGALFAFAQQLLAHPLTKEFSSSLKQPSDAAITEPVAKLRTQIHELCDVQLGAVRERWAETLTHRT